MFHTITALIITISFALIPLKAKATAFDVDKYLEKTYVTIGVGYKFQESTLHYRDSDGMKYEWSDPYSARIEMGYYYNKNIKFGVSHHSQWLTGFPINNDRNEYSKTEIFIDYTFTLK